MGGGKPKPKKQGKKPGQDNKQNQNQNNNNNSGQKGQDRGRDKSRDRDGPRNRDRSKSRDGRFTSVAPWPSNKPYLNVQGNGLVKEMQNHFSVINAVTLLIWLQNAKFILRAHRS